MWDHTGIPGGGSRWETAEIALTQIDEGESKAPNPKSDKFNFRMRISRSDFCACCSYLHRRKLKQ